MTDSSQAGTYSPGAGRPCKVNADEGLVSGGGAGFSRRLLSSAPVESREARARWLAGQDRAAAADRQSGPLRPESRFLSVD